MFNKIFIIIKIQKYQPISAWSLDIGLLLALWMVSTGTLKYLKEI
jgi:hypothetical protein